MTELTFHDLQFALRRCPRMLLEVMKRPDWKGRIFVGGGFLRSIVAGEPVNDIDVFVSNTEAALSLARLLVALQLKKDGVLNEELDKRIYTTPNALTLFTFTPAIQIIHRWVFDNAQAVSNSFDFTCCCAAFWWDGDTWQSTCDDRFYADVAAKRLIYRKPVRNEDAGGSMLRVLKYYQKGYRIPLDSMGAVIARLVKGVKGVDELSEESLGRIITSLLREVDPAIDPSHVAHLPSEQEVVEALVDALPSEG